jgi:hypothetical protein
MHGCAAAAVHCRARKRGDVGVIGVLGIATAEGYARAKSATLGKNHQEAPTFIFL